MSARRYPLSVGVLLACLLGVGLVLLSDLWRRQEAEQIREKSEQFSRLLMVNLETFFREPANALVLMTDIYRDGRIRSNEDFSYYASQVFELIPGLRSVS